MSLLAGVTAGIIADKSSDAVKEARQRTVEIQREDRFSSELGPIATEFNAAIGDRLQERAQSIDTDDLHGLAVNWDVIAGDIDTSDQLFESESDAIEWITTEITEHEDVDLSDAAKTELRHILADEYATAVEDFTDRVASDETLQTRFQTELELDLHHQLQEIQQGFDRLADRTPYTLFAFPEQREAIVDRLLPEDPVSFIDRPELAAEPPIDRYLVLAPSGAGKSRLIAEWIRRLSGDAISHVLIPETRLLDPMDTRWLASHEFEGDLLVVWEDIHRVDENADNTVLEQTLRELDHGLQEQGHALHTLLEARSGKLDDIPGNLPADFENQKSLWAQYDPVFVDELNTTRLELMADAMAEKYDMELHTDARDALVEKIQATKSAPIYLETALATADGTLTVADVDELASDTKDIWEQQYQTLQQNSPSEWKVLVAMKLLRDLSLGAYSRLTRAVYVDILDGDRDQYRPAILSLQHRQWITVKGDDPVATESWYQMHATQLEAVKADARDDIYRLSELLNEYVERAVPVEQQGSVHRAVASTLIDFEQYDLSKTHAERACSLDPQNPDAYNVRGIAKSELGDFDGALNDHSEAIELRDDIPVFYFNRGRVNNEVGDYEAAIADYDRAIGLNAEPAMFFFHRGIAKFNNNANDSALEDLNEAINRDPENAEYYYQRGLIQIKLESYADAIDDFDTAIDIDPEQARYFNERARAKSYHDNLDGALSDYSEAIGIDSTESVLYANRGKVRYRDDQYEEAVEDFTEAIKRDPETAEYYSRRGECYFKLSEFEQSITDYDRAIELESSVPGYYYSRGRAHSSLRQYEQAIEDFDRAIEHDHECAQYYFRRGRAHTSLRQYEQAIADYDEAISLDSGNAEYYFYRGIAYSRFGNDEQAIEEYTEALDLTPEDPVIYFHRAKSYANIDAYEQSLSDYDHAIELAPTEAHFYYWRGKVFESVNQYDEAIEDYTQAIELEPGHGGYYKARGWAYLGLSDSESAIDDFQQAIDITSDDSGGYHGRGATKVERGEYQAAIEDYTQAIDLDPYYPDTYFDRGVAKIRVSDYDGAIDDFAQTIQLNEDHIEAWNSRGLVYVVQGKHRKGIADLDTAKALARDNFSPFRYRTIAHLIDGNLESADDFVSQMSDHGNNTQQQALSTLYALIVDILLGRETKQNQTALQSLCDNEGVAKPEPLYIDLFLTEIVHDNSKRERIEEIVDFLR